MLKEWDSGPLSHNLAYRCRGLVEGQGIPITTGYTTSSVKGV